MSGSKGIGTGLSRRTRSVSSSSAAGVVSGGGLYTKGGSGLGAGGERDVDPAEAAAVSRANLGSAGGPEEAGAGMEWVESEIWADSAARARRGSRAKRGSAGRAGALAVEAF